MLNQLRSSLLFPAIIFLSGCDLISPLEINLDTVPTATTSPDPATVPTPTPDSEHPQTLQVWLPAQFDPDSENEAAALLNERLDEFTQLHPGSRVETRIKPAAGPGGLLEFLSASATAAPASVPDLVLLPRADVEAAAYLNLIRPMDDLWDGYLDPDWYSFALDLGRVESQIYGVPFAADALVLVYDDAAIPNPPQSWEQAIESPSAMIFPSADPAALLTTSIYLYQSELSDTSASFPTLNSEALISIFEYYNAGNEAGLFPIWLTQLESDQSAWNSLASGQARMGIAWSSAFFSDSLPGYSADLIPTSDGQPFAPVSGWVWTFPGTNANRQTLALELADFLTDSEFLSNWTAAAKMIAPRASALNLWPEGTQKSLAGQVIPAARLIPSIEITDRLGAVLSRLVIEVIKGDIEANSAAQSAVEAMQND